MEADQTGSGLTEAFQVFNKLSVQLSSSYQELERRVAELSQELSAARNERLLQLAEKERLANRLSQLLAALPAGVVVVDDQGVVEDCNPTAKEFIGEPLIGLQWKEIRGRAFSAEPEDSSEVMSRDGRWLSVSVRTLGLEPGCIVLLKDVTETRALQEMAHRNQRLAAMGEMLAGLSHQIRTPLASAILYVSQLAHHHLRESDRLRFTDKALAQFRYLEKLVNDTLTFARGGNMAMEHIPIASLIDAFVEALEQQLPQARGNLKIDVAATSAVVWGNHQALLGVLVNLATNAIQAAPESARIDLRVLRSQPDRIMLILSDNGPGIPPEIQDRVFDPFFTTRHQGIGLGLAVVRSVVEAHRGVVELESGQPQGTKFKISLPCINEQEQTNGM